jgi:hypothetical protein
MTRALVAIALSALLAACGGAATTPVSPEPPSSQGPVGIVERSAGTAFGTVLDVQANRGIAGATLTWTAYPAPYVTTSTVTDAMGFYAVRLAPGNRYSVSVDIGDGRTHSGGVLLPVTIQATDFLLNAADCDLRYGLIIDAITRRPVSGAQVLWQREVMSAPDGSYQVGSACRPFDLWSYGTTAITVTHPAYISGLALDTRGEALGYPGDERRVDIALTPR